MRPEIYGQPESKGVFYHAMQKMKMQKKRFILNRQPN